MLIVLYHGFMVGYCFWLEACVSCLRLSADANHCRSFCLETILGPIWCQLQMVSPLDHHLLFTPDGGSIFFQYYRCLLSFFMSLCREIIVCISLTASWISNRLCSTASNCSYLNEEKQYPDNSMYSLMFLASILFSYQPPSHLFQA